MKPHVLSDEQIEDSFRLEFGETAKITTNLNALDLEDDMAYFIDVLRHIAKAQRDDDVAFYEQKIREMFEEIERGCGGEGNEYISLAELFMSDFWQALKSKYQETA
jgi:hypothetical protein